DARVYVQLVLPAKDKRSRWLLADKVDSGLYALVSDRIDEAGAWLVLVDVLDADGKLTRLAFSWDIRAEASLINSVSPSLVNIGAGLLVLASIAFIVYPSGRKLASRMDWTVTNMVISGGVILMTIIVLAASTVYLNYQEEQDKLAQNPLPTVINTVVPDA